MDRLPDVLGGAHVKRWKNLIITGFLIAVLFMAALVAYNMKGPNNTKGPKRLTYRPGPGAVPYVMSEGELEAYPYVVDLGLRVPNETVVLFKVDNTYGAILPQQQDGLAGGGWRVDSWYDPTGSGLFWWDQLGASSEDVFTNTVSHPLPATTCTIRGGGVFAYFPLPPFDATPGTYRGKFRWYAFRDGVGIFCPNRHVFFCVTEAKSVYEIVDGSDRRWHYYAGRERYELATRQNLVKENPEGVR